MTVLKILYHYSIFLLSSFYLTFFFFLPLFLPLLLFIFFIFFVFFIPLFYYLLLSSFSVSHPSLNHPLLLSQPPLHMTSSIAFPLRSFSFYLTFFFFLPLFLPLLLFIFFIFFVFFHSLILLPSFIFLFCFTPFSLPPSSSVSTSSPYDFVYRFSSSFFLLLSLSMSPSSFVYASQGIALPSHDITITRTRSPITSIDLRAFCYWIASSAPDEMSPSGCPILTTHPHDDTL